MKISCLRQTIKINDKTYIYIYIIYCISCPRNTDYWCCPSSSSTASFFFTPDFFFYFAICISDLRAMHPWKVGHFCTFVYKCCGTFSLPNIDTIRRIDEFIRYTYSSCIFTIVGVPSILYCEIETIDVQMLMNGSNHNTCYNVPEPDPACPGLGWCRVVTIVPQDAHNICQILVLAI